MLPTRERKTYTYNNPIEWASRAPLVRNPPRSPSLFSRFDRSFTLFLFSLSLGITHWCYNPLVLRRRTCCPVSNTLFFFYPVPSPPWRPYAHFAAVWSFGDRRASIAESAEVRFFGSTQGSFELLIGLFVSRLEQVFLHYRVSTRRVRIVLHRYDNNL